MVITEAQLRDRIIAKCKGKTNVEAAELFGISDVYLGDILRGDRRISNLIAEQLGYRLARTERQYEKIKK